LRRRDEFCRGGDGLTPILRSLDVSYDHAHEIGGHTHDWGQLVYAATGAVTVTAGEATWLIPSARAVWLPSAVEHRLRMRGRTRLNTIYIPSGDCTTLPAAAVGLEVGSLLRALVMDIVGRGALCADDRFHCALRDTLLGLAGEALPLPFLLRIPQDRRALALARCIEADPATGRSLADLSQDRGASLRTMQRLFLDETGMSILEWRQTARLMLAASALLEGASVTVAGLRAGYSGTSAFTFAFRKRTGMTPMAFRAAMRTDMR
jgi:AraC-like DNA-binding protein